jgi:hypothetical protein
LRFERAALAVTFWLCEDEVRTVPAAGNTRRRTDDKRVLGFEVGGLAGACRGASTVTGGNASPGVSAMAIEGMTKKAPQSASTPVLLKAR